MFIKAFYKHIPISILQLSICDTRQIDSLLNEVDKFSHIIETPTQNSVYTHVRNAIRELQNAIGLDIDDGAKGYRHFDTRQFDTRQNLVKSDGW